MNTEIESVEEVQEEVVEVVDADPLGEVFEDVTPQETGVIEEPEPPAAEVVEPVEATPEPKPEPVEEPDYKAQVEAFKAKALDEKNKRQALEKQYENRPPEKLEFDWENPQETIQKLQTDFENKLLVSKLDMSAAQAKSRHEDYDEVEQVFIGMVQENPSIYNQMVSQVDPAEYAYQLAKQKMFTDEVGKDPADYEAKLRAKHFAEFEAEFKNKEKTTAETIANLPPSAKSMTDKNQPAIVVDNDPLGSLFDDVPSG